MGTSDPGGGGISLKEERSKRSVGKRAVPLPLLKKKIRIEKKGKEFTAVRNRVIVLLCRG